MDTLVCAEYSSMCVMFLYCHLCWVQITVKLNVKSDSSLWYIILPSSKSEWKHPNSDNFPPALQLLCDSEEYLTLWKIFSAETFQGWNYCLCDLC